MILTMKLFLAEVVLFSGPTLLVLDISIEVLRSGQNYMVISSSPQGSWKREQQRASPW